MKRITTFLIIAISAVSICFAQAGSSGSSTSVGRSGSSSMGVGNAAGSGASSIGGGNSVGSGSSSMGIGNSAGGGTNGYNSTGAPGSAASGYSSTGVESPGGQYDPNTSGANVPVGGSGSAEVQPSSVDTAVNPSSNPNSGLSNSGSVSDRDSAQ